MQQVFRLIVFFILKQITVYLNFSSSGATSFKLIVLFILKQITVNLNIFTFQITFLHQVQQVFKIIVLFILKQITDNIDILLFQLMFLPHVLRHDQIKVNLNIFMFHFTFLSPGGRHDLGDRHASSRGHVVVARQEQVWRGLLPSTVRWDHQWETTPGSRREGTERA